jgi:hypothetical protein
VLGGSALITTAESFVISTPACGVIELAIAVGATGGVLSWIQRNRAALRRRETPR